MYDSSITLDTFDASLAEALQGEIQRSGRPRRADRLRELMRARW